jgi:hypothetical protein
MPDDGQPLVQPWDEFNQQLVGNVHPTDWQNPTPASRYNLVVIGAGTAGLVTAAGAAGLGAKVALVERHLMGGDCLNVGCVPSKTLLRAARAAHEVHNAERFGVRVSGVEVDFAAVMTRVREVRASISPHDSARRFRELGVDVFLGEAQFVDSKTIAVGGKGCVSDVPSSPPGAGRDAGCSRPERRGFLTNETVFNLTALPAGWLSSAADPLAASWPRPSVGSLRGHALSQQVPSARPRDADAARCAGAIRARRHQRRPDANLLRVAQPSDGKVINSTAPPARRKSSS